MLMDTRLQEQIESGYARALEIAEDADIVILTLGEANCSMASMGEGVDATNINLPECQDAFIRKAAKAWETADRSSF